MTWIGKQDLTNYMKGEKMKKPVCLLLVLVLGSICSSALADFYVIPVGGRVAGTEIKALPCTISASGFYYLTRNLSTTGAGITVSADDVTLDLMGFCITGPGSASGTNNGIHIGEGRSNIEIRNGSIKSFGDYGIYSASGTHSVRVFGIRAAGNHSYGIGLYGNNHAAENCSAFENGGAGIYVGMGGRVKGSQLYNNTSSGIITDYGSMVTGNVSYDNGGAGIWVQFGSSVTDNMLYSNSAQGIIAWANSTVTRNTAHSNVNEGINAGNYCTIIGNTVDGLVNGTNCTVVDNTVTP
jgi:hypothetical protein